jgi:hypothetical protein
MRRVKNILSSIFYNPQTKPLPETGDVLRCEAEGCQQPLDYVWVNTGEAILCIGCFEKLHPRAAAVNRLKKSGEQLEIPLD